MAQRLAITNTAHATQTLGLKDFLVAISVIKKPTSELGTTKLIVVAITLGNGTKSSKNGCRTVSSTVTAVSKTWMNNSMPATKVACGTASLHSLRFSITTRTTGRQAEYIAPTIPIICRPLTICSKDVPRKKPSESNTSPAAVPTTNKLRNSLALQTILFGHSLLAHRDDSHAGQESPKWNSLHVTSYRIHFHYRRTYHAPIYDNRSIKFLDSLSYSFLCRTIE